MKIPIVKITLNKEWDKEVITYFLDEKDKEYDFGFERIISIHPELSTVRGKSIKEKTAVIYPYVDNYYVGSQIAIENAVREFETIWAKIAPMYFIELEKIFGSLDFYKQEEIMAALSITKAGVIGDDNASFQIWYKTTQEPAEVRRHFAHEILHFFYYAYLMEKKMFALAENWDKAEIFNVVILALPQFVELIGKEDLGYQQHEKYFSHYKKIWKESVDLNDYLHKIGPLKQ